jgi:outer membrane protein assembly factor BamB
MPAFLARSAGRLTGLLLVMMIWAPASARADWTTYRGDSGRSGVDSSSVGSLPLASAWTSQNLGGDIYGQPLVHDGLVIVATERDQVVALNEATGQVAWQASAGIPVPSSDLTCGDISPWVGITSTPVIDPATNRVYVVADTLQGGSIQHELYAFDVASGASVPGFPVSVEPPGDVPKDQLQRTALALVGGRIIVGYGGNDGDCGDYHGWLVSAPEAGGSQANFEVEPDTSQGAIWGSGNGPAVDASGNVWVSTGNGNSGSSYEYQESVLKLDPSMHLLDSWAPSNWQQLDGGDVDLGSSDPVLLPGGLVFQIGKEGVGYLLSASRLGGEGASSAYQATVCSNGSWGGAVYFSGIIYVTCADGLRALALNTSAPSFSPVAAWQVNSAINGPPIVAGGLVWATDWNNGALYGLNPETGKAAVNRSTPSMEHFTTPSASDGRLFLATGQTVEAYTIANPAPAASAPPPPPPVAPAKCVLKLRSALVKIHRPKRHKHRKHAPPAYATVALIAKCNQAAQVSIGGTVTERLAKTKHHKARTNTIRLAGARAALAAGVARTVQLRLTPGLLDALLHRVRESASFTLSTTNEGGTTRAEARGRLRS